MTYNVRIQLTTSDILDIDARVEEVHTIVEWIESMVHWNKELYSVKYLPSTHSLDVWFNEEQHATWCKLRWL